jgi:hypothetical protein
MDITSLSFLASTAISILSPYLKILSDGLIKKAGEEIGKATGESAWNKTKQLYEKIKSKFAEKSASRESIEDLEKSPDDPDSQAAARLQLKKILVEDQKFSEELTKIIKEILESEKDETFETKIIGSVENILQISNSSLSNGRDFVGRDRLEIHAQNINIGSTQVQNDQAWIKDRLDWVERVVTGWEYNSEQSDLRQVKDTVHAMEDILLYQEGRSSFNKREYYKAALFWEELWNRNPESLEYSSYLRLCLTKTSRDEDSQRTIQSLLMAVESCICSNNYEAAVELLEKALHLSSFPFQRREIEDRIHSLWDLKEKQKIEWLENILVRAKNALSNQDFHQSELYLSSIFEKEPLPAAIESQATELLSQLKAEREKSKGSK